MFHNIFSDDNLAFTAIHESESRKETREKRRRKSVNLSTTWQRHNCHGRVSAYFFLPTLLKTVDHLLGRTNNCLS